MKIWICQDIWKQCQRLNRAVSGAIIGEGDRKRAPYLELGLSLWYVTLFYIFRTNCAITLGTREYMLQGFLWMSRRENGVQNSRNFYTFGPLLNTFMRSVRILLKYFRRKLPQFEWQWRKTVSNLGMSRFISLTRLCSAASFTRTSHCSSCSTLNFIYVED